ncbi:MAG: signal peptidase I [Planctomycetaceae bacterium]|nr:signal peptidase I [Planctomycetaceae bacterium]
MDESQAQTFSTFAHRHRRAVESAVTLFEWLLVAFILALLFQGFAMQAFQIPTGSMAQTLRGDHFPLRCPRCGYSFDVGSESLTVTRAKCPSCDHRLPPQAVGRMKNGDRIFVLKSIYQFFMPNRWDVVVFKNPTNPRDNFIKRLIGLPNETVQISHGDIYINGVIARKPRRVQEELWMPVYLQDYRPPKNAETADPSDTPNGADALPNAGFVNEEGSGWQINDVSTLNDDSGKRHCMIYQTNNPNDFRAIYSYNEENEYTGKPMVSDLMISFYAAFKGPRTLVGASLEKSGVLYSGYVDEEGAMVFERTAPDGTVQELRRVLSKAPKRGQMERFEFADVDEELILRWGSRRAAYDLTRDPETPSQPNVQSQPPAVRIFAEGETELRHVALYRDTYYLGREGFAERATEDKPFTLKKDQFFVCGDNSNNSLDSRMWSIEGIGNNGSTYDKGVVPKDYMMGKAVMIYWSQAFCLTPRLPSMVPNFNNLKVIYGGSQEEY